MLKSLKNFAEPKLLLYFLLLLSCRVASSWSVLLSDVGVNCSTSAVLGVTSSRAVFTFDLDVL